MAQAKPNMETLFAENGALITPAPAKIEQGHVPNTIAESRFANWQALRADQFLAHMNEYGIPVWDNVTAYPSGAWSRSAIDGKVYESTTLVSAGQADPSSNSNWTGISLGNFVPIAGNVGNPITGDILFDSATDIYGCQTIGLGVKADQVATTIDFRSDTVNSTYSARLQRKSGVDGNLELTNQGTGIVTLLSGGAIGFNSASDNIYLNGARMQTLADPVDDQDAVNLRTLNAKTNISRWARVTNGDTVPSVGAGVGISSVTRTGIGLLSINLSNVVSDNNPVIDIEFVVLNTVNEHRTIVFERNPSTASVIQIRVLDQNNNLADTANFIVAITDLEA